MIPNDNETASKEVVRFRTIGDATCTGAVKSNASTLDEVIAEVAASRITERGSRADDRRSGSRNGRQKKTRILLKFPVNERTKKLFKYGSSAFYNRW